jgi:MFS transporter, PHS family, inorganic phosphate transporter
MLLGCFSTLCIKETARKTVEELAGEDDYAASAHPPAAAAEPAAVDEKKEADSS